MEVIIIDQTAILERKNIPLQNFPKLNLKIIYLNSPGQSSARNVGIINSVGEYILFCDDDIEVKNNFIESHSPLGIYEIKNNYKNLISDYEEWIENSSELIPKLQY